MSSSQRKSSIFIQKKLLKRVRAVRVSRREREEREARKKSERNIFDNQ